MTHLTFGPGSAFNNVSTTRATELWHFSVIQESSSKMSWILLKVIVAFKRSLELLHRRQVHQCPVISLVATAGIMPSVKKRHYHQRKVAGLKFLSLPLQNRGLKEPLCNHRGTEHPSNRWDMSVKLFSGEESLVLWPTHFQSKWSILDMPQGQAQKCPPIRTKKIRVNLKRGDWNECVHLKIAFTYLSKKVWSGKHLVAPQFPLPFLTAFCLGCCHCSAPTTKVPHLGDLEPKFGGCGAQQRPKINGFLDKWLHSFLNGIRFSFLINLLFFF